MNKSIAFQFGNNVEPELFCKHGRIEAECAQCEGEWQLSQQQDKQDRIARAKRDAKNDQKGTKEHPAPNFIIGIIDKNIKELTRRVKEMAPISASSIAPPQKENQQQRALIHGSDCKVNGKELREVTFRITGIRKTPPGFNSPLFLDFEKQFDKETIALNKTNIRSLGALVTEEFGDDDLEKLIGCDVIFQVVQDNNPTTGAMVPTLRVAQDGLINPRKRTSATKKPRK